MRTSWVHVVKLLALSEPSARSLGVVTSKKSSGLLALLGGITEKIIHRNYN